MHPEIKENYREKLRLIALDLISQLDEEINLMMREHSRDGILGSGRTIKKTMDFIAKANENLYTEALTHLDILNPDFYHNLEPDIQALTKTTHEALRPEYFARFKKSTEVSGSPNLYDRMLPEVEAAMATNLAKFHNSLNIKILELKLSKTIPLATKLLLAFEVITLLTTAFVAGAWYKDPSGNYEPIIVGLSLAIPLIYVAIKISAKKAT